MRALTPWPRSTEALIPVGVQTRALVVCPTKSRTRDVFPVPVKEKRFMKRHNVILCKQQSNWLEKLKTFMSSIWKTHHVVKSFHYNEAWRFDLKLNYLHLFGKPKAKCQSAIQLSFVAHLKAQKPGENRFWFDKLSITYHSLYINYSESFINLKLTMIMTKNFRDRAPYRLSFIISTQ